MISRRSFLSTPLAFSVCANEQGISLKKTVYVVESGYYEQRGIHFVAASVEDAIRQIKARHPSPPYIVRWHEPVYGDDGGVGLSADFEAVLGYSTRHTHDWDITPYEVIAEP